VNYDRAIGLFGGKKIRDGVALEATVVQIAPTAKAARQTQKRNVDFAFVLSLQPPGAPGPLEVQHTCTVPYDKVPGRGQRIPVTVSAADPSLLVIAFDAMPTMAERALASAQAAQAGDNAGAAEALGYRLKDEPGEPGR